MFDEWVSLLISAVAPTALVRYPLNLYRQHTTQRLGITKKSLFRRFLQAKRGVDAAHFHHQVNRYTQARDRLLSCQDFPTSPQVTRAFDRKITLCHSRALMRQSLLLRLPLIGKELLQLHYHRYAHGLRTLMLDLLN